MTTIVTTRTPAGAAVGPLAGREAWRMVRHPIYLAMPLYFVLLGGVQAAPTTAYARTLAACLGVLGPTAAAAAGSFTC